MGRTITVYYDEAGRGPLAGPMFIGLICPLKSIPSDKLNIFRDSKQLSENIRESHFEVIKELQKEKKLIYSPARVTASEIDQYGMTNSLHYAILRGMIQIFQILFPEEFSLSVSLPNPISTKIDKKIQIKYSDVLLAFSELNSKGIKVKLILDGNRDFGLKKMFPFWEIETIVSGDAKVKEIGMASIIAKVSRDRVMESLPKKYTKYDFGKHKGYGTKEHKKLIEKYGPSNIHRKLFLKRIYPNHSFEKKIPTAF